MNSHYADASQEIFHGSIDDSLNTVNKYSDYLANNSDDLSFASIWSEYKSRINTLANLIVDVIKPNIKIINLK